jgi:hypothetical protein
MRNATAAITTTVEIAAMKAQFRENRATTDRGPSIAMDPEAELPARSPVQPVNTQKIDDGSAVRFTTLPALT